MSFITVKTSFIGIHKWPDAPDCVAFLRNEHRHIFNVSATCFVTHDDREIEFFMVAERINIIIRSMYGYYHLDLPGTRQLENRSCECIAYDIKIELQKLYNKIFTVTVQEDNESLGATH